MKLFERVRKYLAYRTARKIVRNYKAERYFLHDEEGELVINPKKYPVPRRYLDARIFIRKYEDERKKLEEERKAKRAIEDFVNG